jgi:hypothetical protein
MGILGIDCLTVDPKKLSERLSQKINLIAISLM